MHDVIRCYCILGILSQETLLVNTSNVSTQAPTAPCEPLCVTFEWLGFLPLAQHPGTGRFCQAKRGHPLLAGLERGRAGWKSGHVIAGSTPAVRRTRPE